MIRRKRWSSSWLLGIFFGIVCLVSCATDPSTSTPVAGGAITKFTYENGEISILVNAPSGLTRSSTLVAAAVLFDRDPVTGERKQATTLDEAVSVVWPDNVRFAIPDCAEPATFVSSTVYEVYKVFQYTYPASCTPSNEVRISATATLIVNKTGQPPKTLNGVGASTGGAITYHVIFVTSTSSTGNLGGLSGADSICAARAALGSQTSSLGGNWKAILSDVGVDARDRLNLTGSYSIRNTNGETLFTTASTIWTTSPTNAVRYTENGNAIVSYVWTGTTADGRFNVNSCSGWTESSSSYDGGFGSTNLSTGKWIEQPSSDPCDQSDALYCINSN